MWVTISIYLLAVALCVVLFKVFGYIKRRWQRKNQEENTDFVDGGEDFLTESQLDQQISLLERQRDKLSNGFMQKTSAEQQNSLDRIKKINEKIERLKKSVAKSPVNRKTK